MTILDKARGILDRVERMEALRAELEDSFGVDDDGDAPRVMRDIQSDLALLHRRAFKNLEDLETAELHRANNAICVTDVK